MWGDASHRALSAAPHVHHPTLNCQQVFSSNSHSSKNKRVAPLTSLPRSLPSSPRSLPSSPRSLPSSPRSLKHLSRKRLSPRRIVSFLFFWYIICSSGPLSHQISDSCFLPHKYVFYTLHTCTLKTTSCRLPPVIPGYLQASGSSI